MCLGQAAVIQGATKLYDRLGELSLLRIGQTYVDVCKSRLVIAGILQGALCQIQRLVGTAAEQQQGAVIHQNGRRRLALLQRLPVGVFGEVEAVAHLVRQGQKLEVARLARPQAQGPANCLFGRLVGLGAEIRLRQFVVVIGLCPLFGNCPTALRHAGDEKQQQGEAVGICNVLHNEIVLRFGAVRPACADLRVSWPVQLRQPFEEPGLARVLLAERANAIRKRLCFTVFRSQRLQVEEQVDGLFIAVGFIQ